MLGKELSIAKDAKDKKNANINCTLRLCLLVTIFALIAVMIMFKYYCGQNATSSSTVQASIATSTSGSESALKDLVVQYEQQLNDMKKKLNALSETAVKLPMNPPVKLPSPIASLKTNNSPSGNSLDIPFLIIGIPTVPRKHNEQYLLKTLQSIKKQLIRDPSHALYKKIQVYVMNNTPLGVKHEIFEIAKTNFDNNSAFHFLQNDFKLQDANPEAKDAGNSNVPGHIVRQQTRHVAALAKAAVGKSHYFLFMEDDFEACPEFIRILSYITNKAYSINRDFISIKISYGMNGLLLHNYPTEQYKNEVFDASGEQGSLKGDLDTFADYLIKHQSRRPPDHLSTEWTCGERPESRIHKRNRPHMAYRYNLLNHIGVTSTLRNTEMVNFATCYKELDSSVLFEVDAWKRNQCAHDDIWPCMSQTNAKWVPPYHMHHVPNIPK
jgi:hypothetical protein